MNTIPPATRFQIHAAISTWPEAVMAGFITAMAYLFLQVAWIPGNALSELARTAAELAFAPCSFHAFRLLATSNMLNHRNRR